MEKAKGKEIRLPEKFSNVIMLLLGCLVAIWGTTIFATYLILDAMGLNYTLLIISILLLIVLAFCKNRNSFLKINIALLGIAIVLQFIFVFERDYALSIFTSIATSGAGSSIALMGGVFHKKRADIENKKRINEFLDSSSDEEIERCTDGLLNDATEEEIKRCEEINKGNAKIDSKSHEEKAIDRDKKVARVIEIFLKKKDAVVTIIKVKGRLAIGTVFTAASLVIIVLINIFAINAMYYSSVPLGFANEYKDIQYGPYAIRNTMTIYAPKSVAKREENAAMVFLHPGGWSAGDKTLCSADAKRFTKQGYITMFMNYRFLDEQSGFVMNDLLDDITLGLKELKKWSDDKGWNIKKISLNGYSAGAHLSMLYGYKCQADSPFEISYIAAKAGVFVFDKPEYYPQNITYTGGVIGGGLTNSDVIFSEKGKRLKKKDVVSRPEVIKKLTEISPYTYIADDNPPLIQCYATADDLISIKQVDDIKNLINLAPFENEIILCNCCSHLFLESHKELKAYYTRVEQWAKHFFGY